MFDIASSRKYYDDYTGVYVRVSVDDNNYVVRKHKKKKKQPEGTRIRRAQNIQLIFHATPA